MMTNGIASGNNWFSQLNQLNGTNQANNAGNGVARSDNDADGGAAPAAGGKLFQAIGAALSQIGVGGSQASSTGGNAATSQDPAQALASFMQDLMAALQSQHGAQGGDSDGDNDGSGSVRHAGGHRPNIQADLQSLIQQLSEAGASTLTANTGAASSSNDTLASLQQSFQNLVNSFGGSGSSASLGDFLQAFAANMQGAGTVGNMVKAQA
jgi:hypothetical protein